ncbi:glucan biosynthesis protein D [Salinisphaera orenii MK-B5]|uniref:Glucan biosynthesis protein D n=1 Tax=Salinisphaera orenii MK-B5 TaxID=856730 RepID=A0A423PKB5_9GAMM|nr:glucan biosynthesis protein D [Salinisphaera orenii]ROO26019.1 glucan biosynthesis protein D [Salinisphaera orenii MK-B5]
MHRRTLLKTSLALASLGLPGLPAFARLGDASEAQPFDGERLRQRARELAGRPYESHVETLPATLADLEPLNYQKIRYDPAQALWSGDDAFDLRMTFFHVGMHFNVPVHMHALDPDTGMARPIHFSPSLFDYGQAGVDRAPLTGRDLGFAGFVLASAIRDGHVDEAGAFLGASYFRFLDKNEQYGLSARGLAVNTALASGEEFPDFTDFWFVQPEPGATTVTVYALLDSPSVTGAYRFDIDLREQGAVLDVDMTLFTRRPIERLGIAPMTSMFLKGTSQSQARDTIHPQIHDSDRLEMWRGNGEWICRPLFNPETLQYNAFSDENPRGFGLVQHDHDFDNYRDDVAWYNRRPSLWVEPTSNWGAGEIALVELPTMGETVDNIVAFWIPGDPVEAGQQLDYGYRLYWYPLPPVSPSLAQVDKTWTGMGNVPEGWIPGDRSPEEYARRFAVDFVGDTLDELPDDADVVADISISRGRLGMVQARRFEPIDGYRAIFDWIPETASDEPLSMRLYLRDGDRTLTETWLYQWVPPKPSERYY